MLVLIVGNYTDLCLRCAHDFVGAGIPLLFKPTECLLQRSLSCGELLQDAIYFCELIAECARNAFTSSLVPISAGVPEQNLNQKRDVLE